MEMHSSSQQPRSSKHVPRVVLVHTKFHVTGAGGGTMPIESCLESDKGCPVENAEEKLRQSLPAQTGLITVL